MGTGCYTLLADDNCRFSNDRSLEPHFKAHLVYNIILNGRITFSDNQVICSSNLQALAATDATIKALLHERMFDLAVRLGFDDHEQTPLALVHQMFLKEGKIRYASKHYERSPGLALIEQCANPVYWEYEDVRRRYTETCQKILHSRFQPLLSEAEFDRFIGLIEAEKVRDRGLGREFLQNRLHVQMVEAGIAVDEERRKLIRRCTDAPYLSNLPATIGLNPIYGEEHRESFDLVRGGSPEFETTGESRVPSRFDYEHFVAGLCQLNLDDILSLQELPARRTYLELSARGLGGEDEFEDAYAAFVEFNLLLEDRIARAFPEIAAHSPGTPDRFFSKQRASAYKAAATEDLFGIAVGWICPFLPISTCKQLVLDLRAAVMGPPPEDAAREEVERRIRARRLTHHLERTGAVDRLRGAEQCAVGSPFAKEIIVS